MVASTDIEGPGGVEGQMEELKNCTLQKKSEKGNDYWSTHSEAGNKSGSSGRPKTPHTFL